MTDTQELKLYLQGLPLPADCLSLLEFDICPSRRLAEFPLHEQPVVVPFDKEPWNGLERMTSKCIIYVKRSDGMQ
jgi:hypothetical protein